MTVRLSAVPLVTGRDWRRTVRERVRRAGGALRKSWPRILLGLGAGLAVTVGLAVLLGPPPPGQVRDGLAWVVGTTIITGLVTRLCMVGPRAFAADLVGFPARMVAIVRDDGSAALAHALLGFAAGTLVTWLLGPALSGAVGVGLFIGLGTFIRPIVVGGAMVLWRWVMSRVSPRSPAAAPMEAMTVSLLGSTAAMALALAVPSASLRLAVGVAAVVAALVLAGAGTQSVRIRAVVGVIVAALGAAALIDLAGGFQPVHALGLAPLGLAVGVLVGAPGILRR